MPDVLGRFMVGYLIPEKSGAQPCGKSADASIPASLSRAYIRPTTGRPERLVWYFQRFRSSHVRCPSAVLDPVISKSSSASSVSDGRGISKIAGMFGKEVQWSMMDEDIRFFYSRHRFWCLLSVRRLILCKRFSQQDPAAARAKVRLVVLRASVDEFPHHSAGAAPRPVAVLSPNAHILSRHARRHNQDVSQFAASFSVVVCRSFHFFLRAGKPGVMLQAVHQC